MSKDHNPAPNRPREPGVNKRKSDSMDESLSGSPNLETPCVACLNAMALIPGTVCRKHGYYDICVACNNTNQACNRTLTTADGHLRNCVLELARLSHAVSLGQPIPPNYNQIANDYVRLRRDAGINASPRRNRAAVIDQVRLADPRPGDYSDPRHTPGINVFQYANEDVPRHNSGYIHANPPRNNAAELAPVLDLDQITQALDTHNEFARRTRDVLTLVFAELSAVRHHFGIPDPVVAPEARTVSTAAGAAPGHPAPVATPLQTRKRARVQVQADDGTLVNVTNVRQDLEGNSESGDGSDTLIGSDEMSPQQADSETRGPGLDVECRASSGGVSVQVHVRGIAPARE